jgi:aminopeptidase 2
VVSALGTIGGDEDVVRRSRTALDQALAGGPALDPTLRDGVVRIAAQHGDDRLYDALTATAARAASPGERNLYAQVLTDFRDPRTIDRALQRALSSDMRTQDTARYLASFFDNPVARPRAWSFVKANWNALDPAMRIYNAGVTLTRALDAFCDRETRDDVRAFFEMHRLPGVTAALNQTIERINNCIDLREQQTMPVSDWLAETRSE